MNNTYDLHLLHDILYGCQQPWHSDQQRSENHFCDLIRQTPAIPEPKDMKFRISIPTHYLFTYRVRYYCRLIDNAIAIYLRTAFAICGQQGGDEHITRYQLKRTREQVSTLIHDAVNRCLQLDVSVDDLNKFLHQRDQKEYYVILHYLIAALVRCWLEMQERYLFLIDPAEQRDVKSLYAALVGWTDDPVVTVEALEEMTSKKKGGQKYISTCSLLYNNGDTEERNKCLNDFYSLLLKGEMIAEDTNLQDLLAIFSGTHTNATVNWIGPKHVLKYVIDKLEIKGVLSYYPKDYTKWVIVSHRFRYLSGPMPNIGNETERIREYKELKENLVNTLV